MHSFTLLPSKVEIQKRPSLFSGFFITLGWHLCFYSVATNSNARGQHALVLATHFIRRGYPKHLVKTALAKAELQDRITLLTKKRDKDTKDSNQSFYLVVTHSVESKNR